jgi:aerobic carbon-monoxide dehydrogenase small subunit
MAATTHGIRLRLNGEEHSLSVESNDILLDVLREDLGVKSPKIGCERGDCGACTVLLDGKTVRSCLILAVEADGREIVTVEGLGKDGPTDLQKSFIRHNSFQCGYCAPGMVLAGHELLAKNPAPTEDEVKDALAGNLCRCTGYEPIIRAVLDTRKEPKAEGKGRKKGRREPGAR